MHIKFSSVKPLFVHLSLLMAIFFVSSTSSVAQNALSDSLKTLIAHTSNDTTRFRLVNELATEIINTKPDSALLLLEEILPAVQTIAHTPLLIDLLYTKGRVFAKREQYEDAIVIFEEVKEMTLAINDQKNEAHVLDQIGHAYFYQNETELGIKYLRESLELAEEIGDKEIEFKEANNLGRIYSFISRFGAADTLLNRSLGLQTELGDKRLQAEILVNLGINAARDQQIDKAIAYFNRALKLMRQLNDLPGISITYRNIGFVYYLQGEFPKALENFHNSLTTIENTEFHGEIIASLENLSEGYLSIEDYDNSLIYLERASKIRAEQNGEKQSSEFSFKKGKLLLLGNHYSKALQLLLESLHLKTEAKQFINGDLYWNLGRCYEQLSLPDSALFYYEKAVERSTGSNDLLVQSRSFFGTGQVYEKRGENQKALAFYQDAYIAATSLGSKEIEMDAAEGLYRMHRKQNNTPEALQYFEIARTIQDSLFNEKNVKEVARMQASFEFEKEKQELAFKQEKEREKQGNIRWILGLGLGLVSLLLLVSFGYFRTKQRANINLSKLNKELLDQKSIVEKQKEKLEALDEAKSRFFTNISHEFRTPLTVISGMIEQIEMKPDVWLEKGTQMIKQNTLNLLDLINQILDLRKLESNALQLNLIQGDIIPYLKYIVESYHSFSNSKEVQLHFLGETPSLTMDYDPDKILRIISNILSNAIKFTPKGGHVYFQVVEVNNDDGEEKQLLIRVKDTGIGIPKEDLPQIFDRFYQVDDSITRKGEGTGIGLALTQELVKLMRGQIEVISEVRKDIAGQATGTTFLINLPITNESLLAESFPGSPKVKKEAPKEVFEEEIILTQHQNEKDTTLPTLLIVEDNPDVVQFLVASLEESYHLQIARNGQEGIDIAIEQVPDLIISDVMMPIKDGYELCNTLKQDQRTSHIPIILLTAKADIDSKLSGLEKGADAYLSKPFDQRELLIRLEKLLELRQNLQMHYRSVEPIEKISRPEDAFIQKVQQAIENNIDDDTFGITQLCQSIGLKRAQLHNKLKALTGLSTSIYIRSVRLRKAKHLLETTTFNVSEVAYEVGFKDPKYFSRLYIEEFKELPSKTGR